MDINFKRVPTRHKLEEVTSELTSLKEAFKSQSTPRNPNPNQVGGSFPNSHSPEAGLFGLEATRPTSVDVQVPSFFGIEIFEQSAFEIGEQFLGDIRLSGMAIVQLFEHFRQHYYRHGVVLDTSPSLLELRKGSPILFWAIIITSSRYHPQYSSLYRALTQAYEPLLGSCLLKAILSLSTMHAILIFATWPVPVQSQPQDPTWNYCGLITNAARLLGLHEPGREKEYGFPRATPREVELRSKTWLQIFHRNITYSSRIGVPPALADEPTLRGVVEIASEFMIQDHFRIQLEILRQYAKFTQALQLQPDDAVRDSLVMMASGELQTLRNTSAGKWTADTELQFLGAKLFLLGWSFQGHLHDNELSIPVPRTAPKPNVTQKLIFHEALSSATNYIHAFSELQSLKTPMQPSPGSRADVQRSTSINDDIPSQVYFPKYYFFTLYYAALTLYHFLATLPTASIPDQDLARNHIRLAHTVLMRCALGAESEWMRLAQNIEIVGQFMNSGRRLPPEAQIKSRLGAPLFYDGMLKIAVLKSERGSRSWASDLSQHLPHEGQETKAKEQEIGGHDERGMHDAPASSAVTAGYGRMDPGSGSQGQFIPHEWDDTLWGWDLAMLDAADWQLDWNGLETWQP